MPDPPRTITAFHVRCGEDLGEHSVLSALLEEVCTQMPELRICAPIPKRDDWLDLAREMINGSDAVLVTLSRRSVASPECRVEIAHAADQSKPFVVLRLDADVAIPASWPRSLVESHEATPLIEVQNDAAGAVLIALRAAAQKPST